jgi:hypothetical protein
MNPGSNEKGLTDNPPFYALIDSLQSGVLRADNSDVFSTQMLGRIEIHSQKAAGLIGKKRINPRDKTIMPP